MYEDAAVPDTPSDPGPPNYPPEYSQPGYPQPEYIQPDDQEKSCPQPEPKQGHLQPE